MMISDEYSVKQTSGLWRNTPGKLNLERDTHFCVNVTILATQPSPTILLYKLDS